MNEHGPATKLAERLLLAPGGATMDEIVAAAGGPHYNLLRRLTAQGYTIRKVKEGRATRYFAEPPAAPVFEATITSKGQVTIPKDVRELLGLTAGRNLRFVVEKDGRVAISAAPHSIRDLFGILGKPPRSATLEDMDEAVKRAAIERYLRATR